MMDAEVFRAWITRAAEVIEANRDHLTQLDAAIGDADHGINLARGFNAVLDALGAENRAPTTPGKILMLTGNTIISETRRRRRGRQDHGRRARGREPGLQ
jgi:phosphoenolpyruvate---glycerone phosphotransferase subunit DhaL